MGTHMERSLVELGERFTPRDGEEELDPGVKLGVDVIFTNPLSTLAALKTAGTLASNLGAQINLVVADVVSWALPLTHPPVSAAFTEQRLLHLACQGAQGSVETAVHIYLCRNRQQCLLEALKPHSLVLIGVRKRWWPRWEARLAKALWSRGHHVIFADPE